MSRFSKKLYRLDLNERLITVLRWTERLLVEVSPDKKRNSGLPQPVHCLHVRELVERYGNAEAYELETVLAAQFHDVLEGVSARSVDPEAQSKVLRLRTKLRQWLIEVPELLVEYGVRRRLEILEPEHCAACLVQDMLDLIRAVTEPRGKQYSWLERKCAYLNSVQAGDKRVALISLATKVDALHDAIHEICNKGRLNGWSDGSPGFNIWLFSALAEIYRMRGLRSDALKLYDGLLDAFVEHCTAHSVCGCDREALRFPCPGELRAVRSSFEIGLLELQIPAPAGMIN